jgi:hypothetical protein
LSLFPATAKPAVGSAAIRPASEGDLGAIRDLLTQRDGHPWDDDSTRWFVRNLDPAQCRAWIACDGAKPVAFTNMFLRELDGPSGPIQAGYWANLYVDPVYRGQLLYPRLPHAMLAAARTLPLDLVYTTVRLRDVSLANTRIGFTRIGTWNVLLKLLRPVRLVGKFRRSTPVVAISPPFDRAYGLVMGVPRRTRPGGLAVEEVDLHGPAAAALVELLGATRGGRVMERWTLEKFRYRYRQTRENTRYWVLAVRRGSEVVGGLAYRFAERGHGIRAGVVMDAITAPGDEAALAPALEQAERHAYHQGAELVLFLSGMGPAIDRWFRAQGYRSGVEEYDLLAWPSQKLAEVPALSALDHWRFGFVDHDAF